MFSYACNLLKMDASSADFQQCFKKYLPRNPVNTSSYISLPSKLHHKIHRNKADFLSIEIRSKKKIVILEFWYFAHGSYVKQSTSKRRRFFAHQKYIEESTSKRRQFFAHRNYIEKVLRNDVEIYPYFFWPIDVISTSNWRWFNVVCLVCSHLD